MPDAGSVAMNSLVTTDSHWINKALEVGGIGGLVLMVLATIVVVYLWKVAPIRAEARKRREEGLGVADSKEITIVEAKKLIESELTPLRLAIKKLEEDIQEAIKVARACPMHMESTGKDITRLSESMNAATLSVNSAVERFQSRLDDLMLRMSTGL